MVFSKSLQRQLLSSAGPLLSDLLAGFIYGTSAVVLAQLEEPGSPIPITMDEGSWIASIAVLPMGLGCIASGFIMDAYGRRFNNLIACIPNILGTLLITVATGVWTICVGRLLTGLCVGLACAPCNVYIAETTEPRYRGVLLAIGWLLFALGILIFHAIGTFLNWRVSSGIVALLPTISMILMYFSPETPTWLISKGRNYEAEKALCWLRGDSADSRIELESLLQHAQNTKTMKTKTDWKAELLSREFLKPFLILSAFFSIKQFSVEALVSFYSLSILKSISPDVNEYIATLVMDAIRVIVSAVICILLNTSGNRLLALVSCLGAGLSLLGLAGSLKYPQEDWPTYIPALLLMTHTGFVNIGLVQLPGMMSGELFPDATRGVGSGVSVCFSFLVFFMVVKTGPLLFHSIGTPETFCLYGILTMLGFIFIYFVLPETNKKSLHQIEENLQRKSEANHTETELGELVTEMS